MSEHIRTAMAGALGGAGALGSYSTFVQDLLASEEGARRRTKASIGMTKGTRFTHQVDFREKEDIVANKTETLTNQVICDLTIKKNECRQLNTEHSSLRSLKNSKAKSQTPTTNSNRCKRSEFILVMRLLLID